MIWYATGVVWLIGFLLSWALCYEPRPWRISYVDKVSNKRTVRGHYATRREAEQAIAELSPALPRFILTPTNESRGVK